MPALVEFRRIQEKVAHILSPRDRVLPKEEIAKKISSLRTIADPLLDPKIQDQKLPGLDVFKDIEHGTISFTTGTPRDSKTSVLDPRKNEITLTRTCIDSGGNFWTPTEVDTVRAVQEARRAVLTLRALKTPRPA